MADTLCLLKFCFGKLQKLWSGLKNVTKQNTYTHTHTHTKGQKKTTVELFWFRIRKRKNVGTLGCLAYWTEYFDGQMEPMVYMLLKTNIQISWFW